MSRRRLDMQRSALHHHRQVGKELIPPFKRLSPEPEQIFWSRDLLPEFLWIDALMQEYPQDAAVRTFNDFLSRADRFNSDPQHILDGTVSAFGLIPKARREDFILGLRSELNLVVDKPLGHLLSIYPDCPMRWMALKLTPEKADSSVTRIRAAVGRLMPGKDPYTSLCRALPLNRFFAHDKIMISSHLTETIEAIERYPYGDRDRAETFARTTHNMYLMKLAEENPNTFSWAESFWNGNRTIAPCSYE